MVVRNSGEACDGQHPHVWRWRDGRVPSQRPQTPPRGDILLTQGGDATEPRTGILIALTLAAVIAAPILALIALGTYGSATAGAVEVAEGSSAQLSIDPAHGLPETAVTVKGSAWPARVEVSVILTKQPLEGDPVKTRLASVFASRSGSFALDVIIPPSLIGHETKKVFIEAQSAGNDGAPVNRAPVEFRLIPYPNEVAIRVIDRDSGRALSQAYVELRDPLGNAIRQARSGSDGLVGISNVRPGRSTVHARIRDYLNGSTALTVPDSGHVEISISMEPNPERRLYLPFMERDGLGTLKVAGVDRSSGLRSDLILNLPPNQLGQRASGDTTSRLMTNFDFLVAAGFNSSAKVPPGGTSAQLEIAFKFLRTAGIPIVNSGQTLGPYVYYVGQTANGEVHCSSKQTLSPRLPICSLSTLIPETRD